MTSNIGATEHHQFYGNGAGPAAVAVDLSGNNDAIAGTDHVHHLAFGYGADCTVMVALAIESGVTPAGYLFSRYSGGASLQGIRYDGGSGLELILSGVPTHRLEIPTDGEIVVSWAMTTDPLAPTQVRSEVRSWDNALGGRYEDGASWTHAEPAGLAASDAVWGAQTAAGANSTTGELRGAGFLLHGTGSVQVHRDRVSAASAPTLTGVAGMEHPMPDWSSNVGAHGRPAGPTHYVGARAVAANHLQLVSPLVNLQWHDPVAIPWLTSNARPMWTTAPDGASLMGLPWVWLRPVPQVVTHASCRIYVVASALDFGPYTSSLTFRVWSFNQNPGQDSPTPLAAYSVTETVTSDAATSPGVWLDFDELRLSRTSSGERTWLAVSVEASGAGASNLGIEVHAVIIDPMSIETTDAIGDLGNG